MKDSTKLILAGVGGLTLGYMLFKPKDIGLDAGGRPSGRMFMAMPTDLVNGSSGKVGEVFVTNTSTRGGVPVAYSFKVNIQLYAPGATTPFYDLKALLGGDDAAYGMLRSQNAASEASKRADFLFSIPAVAFAGTYIAKATLYTTDSLTVIGTPVSVNFTVGSAAVVPGGTIAW